MGWRWPIFQSLVPEEDPNLAVSLVPCDAFSLLLTDTVPAP